MTWITQALNAGGTLTVKQVRPRLSWFRATMSWPGEDSVSGKISLGSADSAIQSLDEALMQDCAQEMIDKGAV